MSATSQKNEALTLKNLSKTAMREAGKFLVDLQNGLKRWDDFVKKLHQSLEAQKALKLLVTRFALEETYNGCHGGSHEITPCWSCWKSQCEDAILSIEELLNKVRESRKSAI